ncbi:MAG: hypothetical protein K9H15_05040 [Bacteroidales bacterium]|nr:hypothetical protein [Bacteroidales bacterium]
MRKRCKFEWDFEEIKGFFPKLSYIYNEKSKIWIIFGELDICDQRGNYWDTFDIEISLPITYPYCFPLVKETSKKIIRDAEWHIDKDGYCCVDIDHRLLVLEKRGMNLLIFIKNKIYPYFANQIFKKSKNVYAADTYNHNFEGIMQFYEEDLNIKNNKLAINLLKKVINNNLPERNEICPCGKTKFKYCHFDSVEFLKCLPSHRLQKDLEEFSKLT